MINVNQWKEAEDIDYSVYGTPLESTTYKFSKCLQRDLEKLKNNEWGPYNQIYHVYSILKEKSDAFKNYQ